MRDAVIVSAAGTVVGKAPRGTLRATRPDDLAPAALRAALDGAPNLNATGEIRAPGESALAWLEMAVHLMRNGEYISDHDAAVANRVACVLCAGGVTARTPVSRN